jgi:hypothetical protein
MPLSGGWTADEQGRICASESSPTFAVLIGEIRFFNGLGCESDTTVGVRRSACGAAQARSGRPT